MQGLAAIRSVAILAGAAVIAGCGLEVPELEFGRGRIGRFIADHPPLLADVNELYRWRRIERWSFAEEDPSWRVSRPERLSREADGIRVRRGRDAFTLSRAVSFDADTVDRIEVEIGDFSHGAVLISWRSSESKAEQRMRRAARSGRGRGGSQYEFRVSNHDGWKGRVEQLTLRVNVGQKAAPLVRSLSLGQRVGFHRGRRQAVGRPRTIDLNHDVRSAILNRPGTVTERRHGVLAGDRFRAAIALDESARGSYSFAVELQEEDGRNATLIEKTLGKGDGELGRWHPIEAELGDFAGKRVVIRLLAEAIEGDGDPLDLTMWANPEVLRAPADVRRPSVLLISIDTLRADHLSGYGYHLPTSPNIDGWAARRGAVFLHAVAPSPWTMPSHVSLFTGLDAASHGFNHDVGRLSSGRGLEESDALDMLAERLRREGYSTGAFTGGAYLHPTFGFTQGFDRYEYWPNRSQDLAELATGVARAREWLLERADEPTFFFLHTYEVHDPYRARQPYFERFAASGVEDPDGTVAIGTPTNQVDSGFQQVNRFELRSKSGGDSRVLDEADRPLVRAMYDSGIGYMDELLGGLLHELEDLAPESPPVVIFTSDHGEALGENGLAGHLALFDHTLLVPLIVAAPEGPGAGRRIDAQVRSVDILPTVLELVGLEPGGDIDGVSLVPLMAGAGSGHPLEAWSYAPSLNRGVALRMDNRLKYILNNSAWMPLPGQEELYDLQADPGESVNLAREHPSRDGLHARAVDYLFATAHGVGLRVANHSGGVLRGTIKGALVRPVGTKSPDLRKPWLRWVEMGEMALELPSDEEFTVVFEKVFGTKLELAGELELADRVVPFESRLNLRGLEQSLTMSFDGDRWRSGTEQEPRVATGFAAWWWGAAEVHTESPASEDAELEEALRALGYVE